MRNLRLWAIAALTVGSGLVLADPISIVSSKVTFDQFVNATDAYDLVTEIDNPLVGQGTFGVGLYVAGTYEVAETAAQSSSTLGGSGNVSTLDTSITDAYASTYTTDLFGLGQASSVTITEVEFNLTSGATLDFDVKTSDFANVYAGDYPATAQGFSSAVARFFKYDTGTSAYVEQFVVYGNDTLLSSGFYGSGLYKVYLRVDNFSESLAYPASSYTEGNATFNLTATAVPEPGSMAVLGLALLALRNRKRSF